MKKQLIEHDLRVIDKILNKYNDGPGIAVGVVKDGEVKYKEITGLANLEYSISNEFNTIFNLASISKPITAMGIIILKERGKIRYDDEIIKYFPELSHYCRGVKIKHLLNHTSGIVNYYRILDKIKIKDLGLTNKECLNLLINEEKLLFTPGDKFDYSNSNYVLLSMLIERISGLSFNSFLKENIFTPLGMDDSLVYNENHPIVINRSYGYGKGNKGYYCDYMGALTTGDGCIFSSLNDMIKFERGLYTEKIITKESLDLAFTSDYDNNGDNIGYGFGWETHRSTFNLKRLHHSGSDNGYRNLITTFPEHKLTIILLSNSNEFTWEDRLSLTDEFVKIFI